MKYFSKFFGTINLNKSTLKKNIGSGFDNAFATLPAIILMPITINNMIGVELFDISFIIFISGLSTLFFVIFAGGNGICCLGSSFAFINVTVDMYKLLSKDLENRTEILSYILGAYMFSGILFLIGAVVSKYIPNKLIKAFVPAAVLGPAISLIGLELSSQAIDQTYLNQQNFTYEKVLALITIALVVVISLLKRKHFNNTSISLAIIIVLSICALSPIIDKTFNVPLSSWNLPSLEGQPFFSAPHFEFIVPQFKSYCLVMIIPPTLILFCEHTARRIMVDNLFETLSSDQESGSANKTSIQRTVCANGIINFIISFFNGVPMTMYAESIAVMRINRNTNKMQFIISSLILCIISFLNGAIYLIKYMPKPIIGGVSLVLMGIIAVPGLKILIDEKIDYSKLSNLLLSASVLLIGLSDISINIFNTEIKGMGLGLLSGILLNLVVKTFQYFRLLKDNFTYVEINEICQNFGSFEIKNKTQDSIELLKNKNTYAYLENRNNTIYCNIVVERQYYNEHNDTVYLKQTDEINDDFIRCSIDIDKISKESDLIRMIKTSYELCDKIKEGETHYIFSLDKNSMIGDRI